VALTANPKTVGWKNETIRFGLIASYPFYFKEHVFQLAVIQQ
jgi:hypothetical protein